MGATIDVRIQNRGSVQGGVATRDGAQVAHCDLCGQDVDAVASTSTSGPFACKVCLRGRLEAMTIASYVLREAEEAGAPASKGLPWGKVSG